MDTHNSGEFVQDLQADTLTAYSDLIIGVSDLAERLKTDHDVERTLQSFRYPIASETLAQIPSAIEVRLPEIDEIVIWLSRESDNTHPMLSVEFTNKDSQITLSRDGAMFTGNEHDPDLQLNSDKTLTKIPLVEPGEVNKLLMSLMFPRSDGLYPALDDLTLLKPDTFDALSDALAAEALGGTSVREYELKSSEAYFIHSTVNGKSASFSLQYVDQVTARPIIIQSDMLTDFQLKFFTLGEDEDSYKTPHYPTAEEIQRAYAILRTEAHGISFEIPEEVVENEAINPSEDEEHRSETVLDQLDPDNE